MRYISRAPSLLLLDVIGANGVQLRGALRAAVLPVSVPALLKALDLPSNVQAAMPVGSLVEELRAAGELQVRLQVMSCAVWWSSSSLMTVPVPGR